jgi:hypothetical protein
MFLSVFLTLKIQSSGKKVSSLLSSRSRRGQQRIINQLHQMKLHFRKK